MTLKKRLRVGVFSLVATVCIAGTASAETPKALSDTDARAYASAFEAVEAGDFLGAEIQASEIKDKSLSGYLTYRALMHPTAHTASFGELFSWLAKFRDLPLADRVFALAAKRKPTDAEAPPMPGVVTADAARSEITRPAREAFYSGDPRSAFQLAVDVGERWVAGLSAWRLADYPQAHDYFAQVANDEAEDPWLRAAGAYWAARAAATIGDVHGAGEYLRQAAEAPYTFYGMIAERQLRAPDAGTVTGRGSKVAYRARDPEPELMTFVRSDPRAHRAAALTQIGRGEDARQELRAGLALSRTSAERTAWTALIDALGPAPGTIGPRQSATWLEFQTPILEPKNGFTVDRALVYAIVRRESSFNPNAVSHAGAMGLMQLIPASATLATGDKAYRRTPRILFNPAVNLRAGQDYLTYLMDRGVGPDLLRTVAAYNAGPGAVLKTLNMVGEDDPLLLIECLPALETREYVEKVVAAYWTYKRMFGEPPHTLDALADGARRIDVRLDLPDPAGPQPQAAPQAVEVGAFKSQNTAALN